MDLVFIFTFVELGPDILECDASWYVPVISRGSSPCAGVLVPLEINPGLCVAYQLTAALQTALSDGEGIMKCFQWNGHGSMRPCVGHCKCFQERGAALPLLDV